MPIYEYRCEKGHLFEVMQKMVDPPVVTCETCAAPVQRVFHPIAVHFKGKGFYNTDYGTAKRKREMDKSAKEGGSSSSDSSDSKSSEKGDKKTDKASSSSSSSGGGDSSSSSSSSSSGDS